MALQNHSEMRGCGAVGGGASEYRQARSRVRILLSSGPF